MQYCRLPGYHAGMHSIYINTVCNSVYAASSQVFLCSDDIIVHCNQIDCEQFSKFGKNCNSYLNEFLHSKKFFLRWGKQMWRMNFLYLCCLVRKAAALLQYFRIALFARGVSLMEIIIL